MALPAGVLKPENRAVGMGLFYTITYAGMAALPAVAGWTLDLTHSPNAPIFFGAGLVFLCILLLKIFLLFRKQSL
jgi:MFS family permease